MKKYFLLATTALLLGTNVANAEPVMEDGKITMQVSAKIEDLGLKVDDSYGVNNVEFGKIIIDKDRQPESITSPEDAILAYINPETGALERKGLAFVGYDGTPQRGSFRMTGTNEYIINLYLANASAKGYETYGMEGIEMNCSSYSYNATGVAYFVPEYSVEEEDGNDATKIYVGGALFGVLDKEERGSVSCTGSLEIMLEPKRREE